MVIFEQECVNVASPLVVEVVTMLVVFAVTVTVVVTVGFAFVVDDAFGLVFLFAVAFASLCVSGGGEDCEDKGRYKYETGAFHWGTSLERMTGVYRFVTV